MAHAHASGQGFRINRKTVIMAGDFNHAVAEALNRMVDAAMSKFQFVGRCTIGERKNLMSQANTKQRQIGFHQFFHRGDASGDSGRIAWAVR